MLHVRGRSGRMPMTAVWTLDRWNSSLWRFKQETTFQGREASRRLCKSGGLPASPDWCCVFQGVCIGITCHSVFGPVITYCSFLLGSEAQDDY